MNRIEIEELKEIELNILKYIKEVCQHHNLRYYLAYGTLLGAVRHKGFIPWDDDIDVMMPREDYLKLVHVINEENKQTHYKMICIDSNPNYTAPLAKIIDTRTVLVQTYGYIEKVELGAFVDVFIIDGVPGGYESGIQYYKEAYKIYDKWTKANLQFFPPNMSKLKGLLLGVYSIPLKIRGYGFWLGKLENHNSKYSFDNCEYVSVLEAGTKESSKNVWKRECFGSGCVLSFEGELFSAPEDYDTLLKTEFGDYMKLPPKDQQKPHHQQIVYWR